MTERLCGKLLTFFTLVRIRVTPIIKKKIKIIKKNNNQII